MPGVKIEQGEENRGIPCRCCGALSDLVYGLVYHDEDAHGVYLAGYSEGHRDEGVRFVVSIGDYSEGSVPQDRLAMGMSAKLRGTRVELHVEGPEGCWFSAFPYLGTMLSQEAALSHPHLQAFLDVALAVVKTDVRVRILLQSTRSLPAK